MKCVDLIMVQTLVFTTSIPMKNVIEKLLMTVYGFTVDAAKEITKNQGYDDPLLHCEKASCVGQRVYKWPCHL